MRRAKSGAGPSPRAVANRTGSSGSFHAGEPMPTLASIRRSSTHRYQTFPDAPSKSSKLPAQQRRSETVRSASPSDEDDDDQDDDESHDNDVTPLPIRQLLLLAFLSMSEQTALNSIGPYLPEMVSSMPGIPADESGLFVGIIASAFALAQLSTNFLWGYASDRIGRKPVLLAGTASLMACFCLFGFCQRYWQIVVVHVAMGLLNGNAACVPTVLGEVTDRSNQSRAFIYLPVIYSLGSITGPAVGGVLVGVLGGPRFPYLAPNLVGATMLALSVVVVGIWFEETLDEDEISHWQPEWIRRLSAWFSKPRRPSLNRNSWSARWPQSGRPNPHAPLLSPSSSSTDDDDEGDDTDGAKSHPDNSSAWKDIMNRTSLILLSTYLVFQLSNISFNTLYPIYTSAKAPTGRDLNPRKIGISLAIASIGTILFQAFLFGPLKARMGNLGTYRFALLGIAVSMALMPWIGYSTDEPLFGVGTGKMWLYIELGLILIFKNICTVGGLSSVMLLITNSASSHASLGTINGVAQTLSALGRSIGPFVSGGLFTLSTGVQPKGEALVWSVFGGLALVGSVVSLFIRGTGLESEDWIHANGRDDEQDVHGTSES